MVSDIKPRVEMKNIFSLNPYSTGRWFLINCSSALKTSKVGLNPYSTGRWFLIMNLKTKINITIMSLNPYSTGRWFLIK